MMEMKESLGEILDKESNAFTEAEVVNLGLQLCQILASKQSKEAVEFPLFHLNKLFVVDEKLEAGNGQAKNFQESIHSLGACLFHLATAIAFQIDFLLNGYSLIRQFNSDLSEDLEKIIAKATSFEVKERYTKIDALQNDLKAISDKITAEKKKKEEEAAEAEKKEKKRRIFPRKSTKKKTPAIPPKKEDKDRKEKAEVETKKQPAQTEEEKVIDFSKYSWKSYSKNLPSSALDVRDIAILHNGRWIIATSEGIYQYQNKEQEWIACNKGLEKTKRDIQTIAQTEDGSILIGLFNQDGVYQSKDQCESWQAQNKGLKGIARDIRVIHSCPDMIFIGTYGNGVYASLSYKNKLSWTSCNKGLGGDALNIQAIVSLRGAIMFIGTGDGVYRSENHEENWQTYMNSLEIIQSPEVVALSFSAEDILISSFGLHGLYQIPALQEKKSWQPIGIPKRCIVNAMAFRNNTLLAGTNNGVYQRRDGNWTGCNQGLDLEAFKIAVKVIRFLENGMPIIGTNHGIYILEEKEAKDE